MPCARNLRAHSDAQVQKPSSIAELGFNSPILVDSSAVIIAGHDGLAAHWTSAALLAPHVTAHYRSGSDRNPAHVTW
jgi:hypothetical protein